MPGRDSSQSGFRRGMGVGKGKFRRVICQMGGACLVSFYIQTDIRKCEAEMVRVQTLDSLRMLPDFLGTDINDPASSLGNDHGLGRDIRGRSLAWLLVPCQD